VNEENKMAEGKYAKLIKTGDLIGISSHPDKVTSPMIHYDGKEASNADFTY
jgi:hypothetical protein